MFCFYKGLIAPVRLRGLTEKAVPGEELCAGAAQKAQQCPNKLINTQHLFFTIKTILELGTLLSFLFQLFGTTRLISKVK